MSKSAALGRGFVRIICSLNHPNILPIIDFGQEADGLIYLITKFATHGSLAARLGQALPLKDVVYFIDKIAAALDHAYDRNRLHRNIKPGNVLLDDNDWVLLTDFGMVNGTFLMKENCRRCFYFPSRSQAIVWGKYRGLPRCMLSN